MRRPGSRATDVQGSFPLDLASRVWGSNDVEVKALQPDRRVEVLGACPLLGERRGTAPLPRPLTGVSAVALP